MCALLIFASCGSAVAENRDRAAYFDLWEEMKGPWPTIEKIKDFFGVKAKVDITDWTEEPAQVVPSGDGAFQLLDSDLERIEKAKEADIKPSFPESGGPILHIISCQRKPENGKEIMVDIRILGDIKGKRDNYGVFLTDYPDPVKIEAWENGEELIAQMIFSRGFTLENGNYRIENLYLDKEPDGALLVSVSVDKNENNQWIEQSTRYLGEQETALLSIIKTQMLPSGQLGVRLEVFGPSDKGKEMSSYSYKDPLSFNVYEGDRLIGTSPEMLIRFNENGLADVGIKANLKTDKNIRVIAYANGEEVAAWNP